MIDTWNSHCVYDEHTLSPECRLPVSDGMTAGEPTRIEQRTLLFQEKCRVNGGLMMRPGGGFWRMVPVEWQAARFTLPASRLTGLGPNFPREALGYERVVSLAWQQWRPDFLGCVNPGG